MHFLNFIQQKLAKEMRFEKYIVPTLLQATPLCTFRGERRKTKKPEFIEVNPMGQVPAISDGDFYLFESHAILSYLASAYPGTAYRWYLAGLMKWVKINSVLHWHHTNLRRATHVVRTTVAPKLGFPINLSVAAKAEQTLTKSLLTVETFWLKEDGKFLIGGSEPSIAESDFVPGLVQVSEGMHICTRPFFVLNFLYQYAG